MTRDEILKLEPGPELDRLVAEQIMGWKEGPDFWVSFEGVVHLKAGEISPGHVVYRGEPWSPSSTDIAAAWEVVQRLISGGIFVDIESTVAGEFRIRLWEFGSNRSFGRGIRPPSPLAISRAALLAVMEASDEQ